jgi:hypothetical protein
MSTTFTQIVTFVTKLFGLKSAKIHMSTAWFALIAHSDPDPLPLLPRSRFDSDLSTRFLPHTIILLSIHYTSVLLHGLLAWAVSTWRCLRSATVAGIHLLDVNLPLIRVYILNNLRAL